MSVAGRAALEVELVELSWSGSWTTRNKEGRRGKAAAETEQVPVDSDARSDAGSSGAGSATTPRLRRRLLSHAREVEAWWSCGWTRCWGLPADGALVDRRGPVSVHARYRYR